MNRLLSLIALITLISSNTWGADFTETFDDPTLSSAWQVAANPGYSFQLSAGRGAFLKTANSPDGLVSLSTTFQIIGDFNVTVDVDGRADGPLYPGLNLSWVSGGTYAQIFFFGPQQTYRAIGAPSISYLRQSFGQTNTMQPKFRITRVGTTLSLFVDRGEGGFDLVLNDTNSAFSGPVVAQLIAVDQDSSSNGNGSGVSYFDNLVVRADSITAVPEPESAVLLLAGLSFLLYFKFNKKGKGQGDRYFAVAVKSSAFSGPQRVERCASKAIGSPQRSWQLERAFVLSASAGVQRVREAV